MAIMNNSKYPQRSSFIACATGGTSFNHTSFFNPSDANSSFSSLPSAGSSTSSPIVNEPLTSFTEHPAQQLVAGHVPRKRGRKRTKITDPNHIPRPMNSFIQFRRQWVAQHRDTELAKGAKTLSKLAGEAWHQLSKEQRDQFNELAKEAKKQHAAAYPSYKYEPKRKAPKAVLAKPRRSVSIESDPEWVPSILRQNDSSTSSERSSQPPSDMYLTTDDSDVDSLTTPFYSRGSSVDLSYNPDDDVTTAVTDAASAPSYPSFGPFSGMNNTVVVSLKDDRTPTQADFSYNVHASMLPDQQIPSNSTNVTYPEYGAASNAHDLATLPQYDPSTLPQPSQQAFPYYHALPLQQVAHSLPSDLDGITLGASQGSTTASLSFYDEIRFPFQLSDGSISSIGASNDTAHPAQSHFNNTNNSLYASAPDNTTSQFVTTAPFNDFLSPVEGGYSLTPLSQLFFEHDKNSKSASSTSSASKEMEELQDSFIASLEAAPSFWAGNVQEAFDVGSTWGVSN